MSPNDRSPDFLCPVSVSPPDSPRGSDRHWHRHDTEDIGLTMPERVSRYLKSNHPQAYCDDCIAQALGIHRAQVSLITSTLGLCREFSRGSKTCAACANPRKFASHYHGQ
jgi:hypothetical protein